MKRIINRVLQSFLFYILVFSYIVLNPITAEATDNNRVLICEQGRYAVFTGVPVSSSTNIRTSEFVAVMGGHGLGLQIPYQYSVTVHQYRNKSLDSFIESKAGITGNSFIELKTETQFIHLSIKKKNNTSISASEGNFVKITQQYNQEKEEVDNSMWEQGRYAVYTGTPVVSSIKGARAAMPFSYLFDFCSVKMI